MCGCGQTVGASFTTTLLQFLTGITAGLHATWKKTGVRRTEELRQMTNDEVAKYINEEGAGFGISCYFWHQCDLRRQFFLVFPLAGKTVGGLVRVEGLVSAIDREHIRGELYGREDNGDPGLFKKMNDKMRDKFASALVDSAPADNNGLSECHWCQKPTGKLQLFSGSVDHCKGCDK